MKALPRLFLLLLGTFLACHFLPYLHWLAFAPKLRSPQVHYSALARDFLLLGIKGETVHYTDSQGTSLTRDRFEELLPLANWPQLTKDGRMPTHIHGAPIPLDQLRRSQFSMRAKPEDFDSPRPGLTHLLEAGGDRVRLEMPSEVLRLGRDRLEFLTPSDNTTLPAKSALFTKALLDAGLHFPLQLYASNPTNRKPYDEGLYLVDADGQAFLLRQLRGTPEVTALAPKGWSGLKLRHILVQESEGREPRAVLFTKDDRVLVVLGEEHRLVALPLRSFRTGLSSFSLRGDLLNRLVVCETDGHLEAVALDRDYRELQRLERMLPRRSDTTTGRVASLLFPISWQLVSPTSGYAWIYASIGSAKALILSALLAVLWFFLATRTPARPFRFILAECVIIMAAGLPGLIAAWLLPVHSVPESPGA